MESEQSQSQWLVQVWIIDLKVVTSKVDSNFPCYIQCVHEII